MYARDIGLIATPVGPIRIEGEGGSITRIEILIGDHAHIPPTCAVIDAAITQLYQWFNGGIQRFDLPLAPAATLRGAVLRQALIDTGYGSTFSYGAFARRISSGSRAIGQLCARNPFPIVVPCHRILAGGGKLGQYSGGKGPVTKQWLLDHERRHAPKETLI